MKKEWKNLQSKQGLGHPPNYKQSLSEINDKIGLDDMMLARDGGGCWIWCRVVVYVLPIVGGGNRGLARPLQVKLT